MGGLQDFGVSPLGTNWAFRTSWNLVGVLPRGLWDLGTGLDNNCLAAKEHSGPLSHPS